MSDSDSGDAFGPPLPPGFEPEAPEERTCVIGPVLPPGFGAKDKEEELHGEPVEENDGRPESGDSDDSDAVIGPLLPGQDESDRGYDRVQRPILMEDDGKKKREEWMTVIPKKVQKKIGFKSVTQFTKKPDGDDEPVPKSKRTSKKDIELAEALKKYTVMS